jgi:hypothetical protein
LSSAAIDALVFAGCALALCALAVDAFRSGDIANPLTKATIRRADSPFGFWLSCVFFMAFSLGFAFRATQALVRAVTQDVPDPATATDWFGVIIVFGTIAFAAILRGDLLTRWFRRGMPWHRDTWARLRREAALRALIRGLADDPATEVDDLTLDAYVDHAEFGELEALAAHLAAQAAPRRLALAIAEVAESYEPDPDDLLRRAQVDRILAEMDDAADVDPPDQR